MPRRIVPSRKTLRTFAVAGAWFFIVVSLAHLFWAIGHKWSDPAGTTKLYHAVVDGRSYDAWGLTYRGTLGLLTVMGQALVIGAAATASVLPGQRSLKLRRIGHGVLCAWAALWALDLIWLASIDHSPATTAQATLLCLLVGCTGYRATMGWSPGRSTKPPKVPTLGDNGQDVRPAPPLGPEPPGPAARVAAGLELVKKFDPSESPRLKALMSATRRRTAAGLDRVGDFAHKQAQRLAQTK
jgi:hypothetical protein